MRVHWRERTVCRSPRVVRAKRGKRLTVRGTSRHQLGIALDVRPGTGSRNDFACLHKFAQLNPQFGVHFPLGSRDYPHMELRSPLAPRNANAAQPIRVVGSCRSVGSFILLPIVPWG